MITGLSRQMQMNGSLKKSSIKDHSMINLGSQWLSG